MGQKHSLTSLNYQRFHRRLPSIDVDKLIPVWTRVCNDEGSTISRSRLVEFLNEKLVPKIWIDRFLSLSEQAVGTNSANARHHFLSFVSLFVSDDPHVLAELFQILLFEDSVALKIDRKESRKDSKRIIVKLLTEILELYSSISRVSIHWRRWHFPSSYSESALAIHLAKEKSGNICHKSLFQWFSKSSLTRHLICTIFRLVFIPSSADRLSLLPIVFGTVRVGNEHSSSCLIMDCSALAFITYHLPRDMQNEYHLLYSNRVHANHFLKLTSSVCDVGPILLVIRDDQNNVFGGFTRVPWKSNFSTFFGASDCFLFTLYPQMNVYHSSGANTNFMYLDLHEESTFSGLGIGGQLGNFGLFINGECTFGYGSSNPCKTFDSPQLSASRHFRFTQIEAWLVGQKRTRPVLTDEEEGNRSILDSDPTVLALLSLAGHRSRSEVFRDKPGADVLMIQKYI